MIDAETALLIGVMCGLAMGYPVGFLFARGLYRSRTWPR